MIPKGNERLMALISRKEAELSDWRKRVDECKKSAHKLGITVTTEFPVSQINRLESELNFLRAKL